MKVTYWKAKCEEDNDCYSIRKKTKKEVVEAVSKHWRPQGFSKPYKVEIEYGNAFELCDKLKTGDDASGAEDANYVWETK